MAKISLKNIAPIKSLDPIQITLEGETIDVERYLPVEKKATMIERIVSNTIDSTGFGSPLRLNIYFAIEVIRNYTNISITDKMFEQPEKLYDQLKMNGIIDAVIEKIPVGEYTGLREIVKNCVKAVETYQTSFVGMMKTISNDYDATKLNVDELMNTLDQPDKVGLVKDILNKIG